MSKNDKSLVVGLLLFDPDTHEKLEVMTPLKVNKDGSYSFGCFNMQTGGMWKHTIKTEEITRSEMLRMIRYNNDVKLVSGGQGKKVRRRKSNAGGV